MRQSRGKKPSPGSEDEQAAKKRERSSRKPREAASRKKARSKAKGSSVSPPRPYPRHPTVRQMARAALLERTRLEQQVIRSAKEQIPLPLEFVEDPKVRRRRKSEMSREQLLQRLLEPSLTLGETAKILDVHTATVRRYADKGILPHLRTPGNQRRFRLSDVLHFLADRERLLSLYRLSREPHGEEPGELLEEE